MFVCDSILWVLEPLSTPVIGATAYNHRTINDYLIPVPDGDYIIELEEKKKLFLTRTKVHVNHSKVSILHFSAA